jgi:hypothetical protein
VLLSVRHGQYDPKKAPEIIYNFRGFFNGIPRKKSSESSTIAL